LTPQYSLYPVHALILAVQFGYGLRQQNRPIHRRSGLANLAGPGHYNRLDQRWDLVYWPGKRDDLIAVPGNPLEDISVMEDVRLVMKTDIITSTTCMISQAATA